MSAAEDSAVDHAADDAPALYVEGLVKRYGVIEALAGVDLRLDAGEWVALLGPNGAGKTTLMSVIAGVVRPDAGHARRPEVGFVPQEIGLWLRLTARENLRAFARLHGLAGRALDERIDWALSWTRLEDRADDLVGRFSGGMQRRLNIACGVLHAPRVVLLDEPTVGVDPQARHRIWEMLDELRHAGAALLQSTHQLDEIESICDRAVILDHGRVLAEGTVDALVAATLGARRTLRATLDRPAPDLDPGPGLALRGPRIEGTVDDVSTLLADLFTRLSAHDARLVDLRVESPGLEEVFAALTGRELREGRVELPS